jgi:hypothetical protein
MSAGRVSIRDAEPRDCPRITELARISGRTEFDCRGMLAEYDGHLIAAVPFGGSDPVLDPYLPTAGTVAMLRHAMH